MRHLPLFIDGKTGGMNFDIQQDSPPYWRVLIFVLIVISSFFILFARLFQLTIVKGNWYYQMAEANRIKQIIIEPPRGTIVDRHGTILAKNQPADTSIVADRLISYRLYTQPSAFSSVIGYQQIADQADINNDLCQHRLTLGDKVGKKGVEKIYECQLRGIDGKKLIEVNAQGKLLKDLALIKPIAGKTIRLTIDANLQMKAASLFENKKGAVIAVNPLNGEILTLFSSPSYNSQVFSDGNSEKIKMIFDNPDKPLFNRATEGVYPPGSIFKLIVAIASLETKAITPETEYEDTGIIQAGPQTFGNWYYLQYGRTEGMVNLVKAIQRSNDIFFYKIGEKIGPRQIKNWAEKFGLGQPFSFGFEEAEGLIPSPFWKEETLKEKWYLGDTYNLSIGQGYILLTPLQVAMMTAAVANGGYLCRPQLLAGNESSSISKQCKKISVSSSTLTTLHQGMRLACADGGTGWPLFEFKVQSSKFNIDGGDKKPSRLDTTLSDRTSKVEQIRPAEIKIPVACKTGTAESQTKETAPHAWFTVYAPADNPEIVLTVLVENGGQGSDVAAPIAKEILKVYFEKNK